MAAKFNKEMIKGIDKSDMFGLIRDFPEQCESALRIGKSIAIPKTFIKKYSSVVFLGLGGSAIGGDLIRSSVTDECGVPVIVVRDYDIPAFVGPGSLVIASSYSGDTEETLSMYLKAVSKGAKIIVISSGGEISSLALKNKSLLITIPKGFPPRTALGYSFIPALMVLGRIGLVKNKRNDIKEAIDVMKSIFNNDIGSNIESNTAAETAAVLYGKVPVIYSANRNMDVVVTRWRGQINENSKTFASGNVYPEMNHNEIVGWVEPAGVLKNFAVISLRDSGEHGRVSKRIEVTNSILRDIKVPVHEVRSKGKGLLARIMSLVYLGDFVSYYLALMNGIDPTPVDRISFLKKRLKEI